MTRWAGRVLAALLVAAAALSGARAEPLRLNTGVGAPYVTPDRQGFLDLLVAEMFGRTGRAAEMQVYPSAERALLNANSGLDDGDALRVRGLEAIYPNLVRVDETLLSNDFVAYSLRHDFPVGGFEALRPYAIGIIVGWKIFEKNLADGYDVTAVQDPRQLFTLLANGRTDLVLFEGWQGRWLARDMGLPVKVLQPPLVTTEMFLYLNARHADLAPRAAEALRAMKRDGTYAAIRARTLDPLLRR